LDSIVELLLRQLGAASDGSMLPENAQMVIRPIFTWPDGQLRVWMAVNWPN
jgi:hypothetical protein